VGQDGLEDSSAAEVEVSVVGARDGELLRLRGYSGRTQVRALGKAEADATRKRRPEDEDRIRLRMRVCGQGGGGDGDPHCISLSLFFSPLQLRWSSAACGCVGTTGVRGGAVEQEKGFRIIGLTGPRVLP
jgi:hypothetical protein